MRSKRTTNRKRGPAPVKNAVTKRSMNGGFRRLRNDPKPTVSRPKTNFTIEMKGSLEGFGPFEFKMADILAALKVEFGLNTDNIAMMLRSIRVWGQTVNKSTGLPLPSAVTLLVRDPEDGEQMLGQGTDRGTGTNAAAIAYDYPVRQREGLQGSGDSAFCSLHFDNGGPTFRNAYIVRVTGLWWYNFLNPARTSTSAPKANA